MYQCNLNLLVVSDSLMIEAAIKSAALPEDCAVSVNTVPELSEKKDELDGAVIFDGIPAYEKGVGLVGGKTLSVLVSDCAGLSGAAALSQKPDYMWLSGCDSDTDDLLVYSAEKLISAMKQAFDFRLQTICFNTAFDSIPDLVWFKDAKGAHLIVNNGFCEAVAKTKEQIYKKGHYYIWDIPKEEYDQGDYVCLESEEVVMNARETCLFDEKVKTKKGMRQFKTYKSPLIDEDGRIFGTCGVANDVTAQHNINSELEVILDSMPFAVLIDDEKEDVLAVNRTFISYFPEYSEIVGTNLSSWKNSVMRGRLEDSEITVDTAQGMLTLACRIKPIYSIFDEMIGNAVILTDVTGTRRQMEKNAVSANTDPITGLATRSRLFDYADSIKYSPQITAVIADLDDFSGYNDRCGFAAGDRALTETAETIREVFPTDFAARLGADEFIIVINGACPEEELKEQTEKLLSALCEKLSAGEEPIGVSIGVASGSAANGSPQDFEELIKRADRAVRRAKQSGGSRVCTDG